MAYPIIKSDLLKVAPGFQSVKINKKLNRFSMIRFLLPKWYSCGSSLITILGQPNLSKTVTDK